MSCRNKVFVGVMILVSFLFLWSNGSAAEPPVVSADVVIIGGGAAGLTAAVEAANQGVSVILLEKTPVLGGSTIISGGALAFAGTDMQAAKGIKDSNDLLYKDLMTVGENVNDTVQVKTYVDNQLETYEWLKKVGVKFTQITVASGMSVPRGHQVVPPDFIRVMSGAARAKGVQILTEVAAKRLISDPKTDRISAVLAQRGGKDIIYQAKKGVILATGGFSLNKELVAKFVPVMGKARAVVGPGSTGDGLKMAWAHGADIKDTSYIKGTFGWHPDAVSTKERAHIYYYGAIIVNKNGKRFVKESISYKLLGDAALEQPGSIGFSLWDSKIREAAKNDALATTLNVEKAGRVYEAQTLAELAKKMDVPAEALEATVKAYNEGVEKGIDPQLGRTTLTANYGKPVKIDTPPFYALKATAMILGTYGGILIDGKARVVDVFGKPIPGLYAAGEVTGGVHGAAYMTGSAFGKAVIFGRIAAKSALSGE